MRKLLWIGSYVTKEVIDELNRMGYNNAASYLSQKNILEGIETVSSQSFDSIGAIVLPDFPKCKILRFQGRILQEKHNSKKLLAGYTNIKYLNKISTSRNLVKEAKKWAKSNQIAQDYIDIYVYEMRSACINAAVAIKKMLPIVKIHLIIPDLPLFMDLNMSNLKRVFKTVDQSSMIKKFKYIDSFIVYTAPMAEYLGINDRKWMVVEGSVNVSELKNHKTVMEAEAVNSEKHIVMYSGNVDKKYGIMELIQAFEYLDDQYELWITGGGPEKETIKKIAEKNDKIKYYGFLPQRNDVLKMQQKAEMLINIRCPEEAASRYSFPSKLFEYLLMGKPVLSCRLEGIPDEYFRYMIEIKSKDPKDIADAICSTAVMSAADKCKLGKRAKTFVSEQKNNLVQAKKIYDFVNNN